MKPITLEWVDKAEGDYIAAQREARARKHPVYDVACFHAQQCAEKYLKARLVEAGLAFGKTHNLIALLSLILPVEPTWRSLQPALNALNVYAVDYRYPGYSATKIEAQSALKNCRNVRREIRQAFGLPV
jgi:HEPN domain-containing protein